jgi:cobalt-zinc-cadmium resistance protein CzcA
MLMRVVLACKYTRAPLPSRISESGQSQPRTVGALRQGAELQCQRVLMTALAAAIGLLPASVATGIGAET